MKKAKSLFFYLLLIGTLNNINYIFSEDVEKPEWFQRLEQLKNSSAGYHEKWIQMFKELPPDIKQQIKEKLYKPLDRTSIKQVAHRDRSHNYSFTFAHMRFSFPNPLAMFASFTQSKNISLINEKNPSFVSLAISVAGTSFPDSTLKTTLKKAWYALLQDFSPLSNDYKNKAMQIMFEELGKIINISSYAGFYTTKCIEATAFSNDN